jgi:ceramide glucosyltransferase
MPSSLVRWSLEAVRVVGPALAGGYLLALAVAFRLARRHFARVDRSETEPAAAPAVSLICSLRGEDAGLLDNFRSFFRQDYPGDLEIIFAVEDPADPAASLARTALGEYPMGGGRLVIAGSGGGRAIGKHRNMLSGFAASRHPIIVFSDQDARLPPTFLTEAVRVASSPETGLAFPAPLYFGAKNAGAAFYKLAYNPISLLLHGAMAELGRLKTAIGSVLILRREVFERIDGPGLLECHAIGDDLVLARAVRHAGYRIRLLRSSVRIFLPRQSLSGLWGQFRRWFAVVRYHHPLASILALVPSFPLLWSLAAAGASLAAGRSVALGLGAAAAAVCGEAAVMASIDLRWIGERGWGRFLWMAGLFEPLFFAIFLSSLFVRKVLWRGGTWDIRPRRPGPGAGTRSE